MSVLRRRLLMGRGRGGYYRKILSSNPIAYWPLWETSGTVAECLTDSNMNGTYARDVSTMGTGAGIGDGRETPFYNLTADYNNIYSAALNAALGRAEGSLAIWLKVNRADRWIDAGNRFCVNLRADLNNRILIAKAATNYTLLFRVNAGGTSRSYEWTIADTNWIHAALSWSVAGSSVNFYGNGVLLSSSGAPGTWAGDLSTTETVIGAAETVPAYVWGGYLAHAAIWDRALSAAEVAALSHV